MNEVEVGGGALSAGCCQAESENEAIVMEDRIDLLESLSAIATAGSR